MNRFITSLHLAAMTVGLLAFGGGRLAAVDNLQVNVTVTIAASISVTWCDSAGNNDTTTAQTWAIGNATIAGIYDTDTANDPPTAGEYWANGAGTDAGVPTYAYIQNLSNTAVDVDLTCANSANWNCEAAAATNAFRMRASVDGGTAWNALDDVTAWEAHNALGNGALTGAILLELSAPTFVTAGLGVQQTIVVTATASVDN